MAELASFKDAETYCCILFSNGTDLLRDSKSTRIRVREAVAEAAADAAVWLLQLVSENSRFRMGNVCESNCADGNKRWRRCWCFDDDWGGLFDDNSGHAWLLLTVSLLLSTTKDVGSLIFDGIFDVVVSQLLMLET